MNESGRRDETQRVSAERPVDQVEGRDPGPKGGGAGEDNAAMEYAKRTREGVISSLTSSRARLFSASAF